MRRLILWSTLCLCLPVGAFQDAVSPVMIQQRLAQVTVKLADRRARLEALFQDAGCTGDRLTTQPVPRSKEPNVICTLPGDGAGVIVVGGHFDLADRGMGAVDDWSGAALLPSLYQSLVGKPRRHTFVFIGFAAEETGLRGSAEFVKRLVAAERAEIRAMVNLECLGLTPPKVGKGGADEQLLKAYFKMSESLQIEPVLVTLDDRYFSEDSRSFRDAKIPAILFHSVTQETLPILHSSKDNLKAINPEHYYAAYRLTARYLAYLDESLSRSK